MWNDAESLRSLSHGLMLAAASFAMLTAFATGLRYYIDRRVSNLSSIERAAEDARQESARLARESELRSQVAAAEKELSESKGKLTEIEQRTKPRTLSATQKQSLSSALSNCPNKVLEIVVPMGDHEAYSFGEELGAVFKSAGWKFDGIDQAVFTGRPIGLALRIRDKSKVPACAALVQKVFSSVGIDAPGEVSPNGAVDSVSILVGHKS